ncbi:unnamed protein product, partial [Ascophyllum nodosum]
PRGDKIGQPYLHLTSSTHICIKTRNCKPLQRLGTATTRSVRVKSYFVSPSTNIFGRADFVVRYDMQANKGKKHFLARHIAIHFFFRVQLKLYRITFNVAAQKRQKKV